MMDRKVQCTGSVLETVAYRTAATFPILRSISLLSTYVSTQTLFLSPSDIYSLPPPSNTQ